MRIYIDTDLEGISGICTWDQARDYSNPLYQVARRFLMEDIAAAAQGCFDAGADEVWAEDGHGGRLNFMPELMMPGVRYNTGVRRPPIEEYKHIFEGFDGSIELGFHAMARTRQAFLQHTQSSRAGYMYWYNGRESGEIAQSALFSGHFGTPVIMVTGDKAACAEAREFLGPDIVTVVVKEAYSEEFGTLVPPEEAHEMIRQGAREAVSRIGRCKPYVIDLPIHAKLYVPDKTDADKRAGGAWTRVDEHTFERTFEDTLNIFS